LEGVYRGQELTAAYGSFDAVYSSDIPRAKATANLRAVGGDYARDKIVYSPELTEDSSLGSVSLFLDILAAEASLNGFRHVHLVTHAPVIEKIFSLLSPPMLTFCITAPPDANTALFSKVTIPTSKTNSKNISVKNIPIIPKQILWSKPEKNRLITRFSALLTPLTIFFHPKKTA
jgi:phosphohistidine phosphatase SixA